MIPKAKKISDAGEGQRRTGHPLLVGPDIQGKSSDVVHQWNYVPGAIHPEVKGLDVVVARIAGVHTNPILTVCGIRAQPP